MKNFLFSFLATIFLLALSFVNPVKNMVAADNSGSAVAVSNNAVAEEYRSVHDLLRYENTLSGWRVQSTKFKVQSTKVEQRVDAAIDPNILHPRTRLYLSSLRY